MMKRFPERTYDVGIAEQHAVVFACGLAIAGYRPVCAIYSTFLQRAFDPIVHDAAMQELPVVFAIDRAGLVGDDGPTHHGAFDLAYLRAIPSLTVMAPMDEAELVDMLHTALRMDGPAAMRYPRGAGPGRRRAGARRPLEVGRAQVLEAGERRRADRLRPRRGCCAQGAADARGRAASAPARPWSTPASASRSTAPACASSRAGTSSGHGGGPRRAGRLRQRRAGGAGGRGRPRPAPRAAGPVRGARQARAAAAEVGLTPERVAAEALGRRPAADGRAAFSTLSDPSGFAALQPELGRRVRRIVWCTLATTDLRGRPRTRIVHAWWEGSTAWVTVRPDSPKVRHVARVPWTSLTYWYQAHATVMAECAARLEPDAAERRRVWRAGAGPSWATALTPRRAPASASPRS